MFLRQQLSGDKHGWLSHLQHSNAVWPLSSVAAFGHLRFVPAGTAPEGTTARCSAAPPKGYLAFIAVHPGSNPFTRQVAVHKSSRPNPKREHAR
ncbi:hypothetical protein MRX96_003175 [Rhipicephalus microplus]